MASRIVSPPPEPSRSSAFRPTKWLTPACLGRAQTDATKSLAPRLRGRKNRAAEALSYNGLTARPDSDIDLLVEFEPGWEPGLLGLATMEAELAALLGGKKVDLRTPQDLSRHFRDRVLRTAEVQYAG